ncbi:MAG: hypothetical protein IPO29_11700 [Anaerolineae bacterium]|nr:hypothetical protein [Anaerolineae bacterium]
MARSTRWIGAWVAKAESPQGPVTCRRVFARAAGSAVVILTAVWEFGQTRYEELAVFAPGDDGGLAFCPSPRMASAQRGNSPQRPICIPRR